MRKGKLIFENEEPLIQDEFTNEKFEFSDPAQVRHVSSSPNKDRLRFFINDDHVEEKAKAVVIAKTANMMANVNWFAPLADAYGQYVAGRKSEDKGCKSFSDWYFEVSI